MIFHIAYHNEQIAREVAKRHKLSRPEFSGQYWVVCVHAHPSMLTFDWKVDFMVWVQTPKRVHHLLPLRYWEAVRSFESILEEARKPRWVAVS